MIKRKGKNYTIKTSSAHELAKHSLNMTNELEKTVPKQTILDTLVGLLSDKTVYNKVRKIIKQK